MTTQQQSIIMFPKPSKPKLPTMGENVEKFEFKNPSVRHAGYAGGAAGYPGKFEKPTMRKPHKRF
jgi:hypothetical protein